MNSNKLHVQQFDWLRSLEANKVTKVDQTFSDREKQHLYNVFQCKWLLGSINQI